MGSYEAYLPRILRPENVEVKPRGTMGWGLALLRRTSHQVRGRDQAASLSGMNELRRANPENQALRAIGPRASGEFVESMRVLVPTMPTFL